MLNEDDDKALKTYLDRVCHWVSSQFAYNGDALPSVIVLPRPVCADHFEQACFILSEMVHDDFDGAPLPPLVFDGEHMTRQ